METRKIVRGVGRLASWVSITLPEGPTRGSAPGLFRGMENHCAGGPAGHEAATGLDLSNLGRANLGREERLIFNKLQLDVHF